MFRKLALVAMFALVLGLPLQVHAQDKTAEELVASMRKADMTYRQLMQVFGSSMQQISLGIYAQNKQLVETGAQYILGHPAPNHKPWSIMPLQDQDDFKDALLSFDPLLDLNVNVIVQNVKANDWLAAGEALNDLNSTCISCHSEWKNKVK